MIYDRLKKGKRIRLIMDTPAAPLPKRHNNDEGNQEGPVHKKHKSKSGEKSPGQSNVDDTSRETITSASGGEAPAVHIITITG
jgi:hypothetical protein